MKTPKFKREQFLHRHEHLQWVCNHTKHTILISYGKSMTQEIRIHGSGEIVGDLTDRSKLIGQFIDLSRIEVGKHLYLFDNATSQYIKSKYRTDYIFPEKESTKENDCETMADEDEFNFESSIDKLSDLYEEGKDKLNLLSIDIHHIPAYHRLFGVLTELRDLSAITMQKLDALSTKK